MAKYWPPPEEHERQKRVAAIVRPIALALIIFFVAMLGWLFSRLG
jgi:flagellar biogenesis protein FliO